MNATSQADLFRALKGGGNNFGIVTRFDFTPFAQGQILGGNVVQTISNRGAVFKAFADIAGSPEYDPYASLVTGLLFNSTSKAWIMSTAAIYTKPILNPQVYAALRAIPSIANTLHITNLSTLAAEAATPQMSVMLFSSYCSYCPIVQVPFRNPTIHSFKSTKTSATELISHHRL